MTALTVLACASKVMSPASAAQDPAAQFPSLVLHWFEAVSAAPAAPPVAANDRVYVALRTGTVVAHSLATGAQLWSVDIAADQPLGLDEHHVFVASGETVYALNSASGTGSWRSATGKVTAPPLAHAGWLIVAAAEALIAFRASDGTRVWRQDLGAMERRPFIQGDWLFTSMVDGRILKLNLPDGTPVWERRLVAPTGEPLVVGDRLYVGAGDKKFYCLDATDGEIEWPFRFGSEVRGRPAADAQRVYFTALDNEVRALDLGHGAQRWHRGVPFRPSAGPVVLGDIIAVTGPVPEVHLFAAADGTRLKNLAVKEPLASEAPAFVDASLAELRIAAVTGGLNVQWKLAVFGPAGEAPEPIPVLPLTELPGAVLPLAR